jgi:hypothetical protein
MGGHPDVGKVTRSYIHTMSCRHHLQRSIMFNHTVLKRSLAICLALGAAAPAAANARAILPGDPGAHGPVQVHASSVASGTHRVSHTVNAAAAEGFRWDDAGIGAGATLALLGAGGLATIGVRRRQTQREVVS